MQLYANEIGAVMVLLSICLSRGSERLPIIVLAGYALFFVVIKKIGGNGEVVILDEPVSEYFIYMIAALTISVIAIAFHENKSTLIFAGYCIALAMSHCLQGISTISETGHVTAPYHSFIQKLAVPLDLLFAYWWILRGERNHNFLSPRP